MKKSEIKKLDKLNEQKKLTKEVKNRISLKALDNFLIAIDILLLFIIFLISSRNLNKQTVLLIYKLSSTILLLFTLTIFEIAYKKDNDEQAIYGIEMLCLSITVLLMPYFFVEKGNIATTIVGCYFTLYYILKNLVIYKKEKNKYLKEKSDILEIIQKESNDKRAQEEKEKAKQTEPLKRKRGRPRKVIK